ncbi:MAG: glycosyltransferase family 2 protein [Pseudobdellovibrionaceae bacterium]
MNLAVIIPCHNEELTIAKVVKDCQKYLPQAQVYVFDNISTDKTAETAKNCGATVVYSPKKGKGNVIRHAFSTVEADIYIVIDGDDTYPIEEAHKLIQPVQSGNFSMAVGTRQEFHTEKAFRRFHLFGNKFFSKVVSLSFGKEISDMLSGYRVFSKEFVKLVPLRSQGFEVETDLTLQAISKNFDIVEIPISYRNRPQGSTSKLKTFSDGTLILKFIFHLAKDYRPLPFFTFASLSCVLLSLLAGYAPILEFIEYAYVYKVPRAVLAGCLMILAVVFLGVGLVLDSQIRYFNDQFILLRRIYLQKNK